MLGKKLLSATGAARKKPKAIAIGHATTPFITAYPWSGSGFGTKYANPSTLPTGLVWGVAWSTVGA
jgi:hypothetical protein